MAVYFLNFDPLLMCHEKRNPACERRRISGRRFSLPEKLLPVEEKRRVRRLKETTAKSYCFHACCFKECGF